MAKTTRQPRQPMSPTRAIENTADSCPRDASNSSASPGKSAENEYTEPKVTAVTT